MYLKLNFTNPSPGSTINIYRGDTPLDRSNLSNPIATLTNGETTWTDNNVVRGQYYYYVFETVVTTSGSADKVASNNYYLQAVPRLGAGPSQLAAGDLDYGYFGKINAADFIGASTLVAQVGLGSIGTQTVNNPAWYKYARNGKILFIPEGSIRTGMSWTQLYNLGLVFGVDGPGPYNAGADVNQKKVVTIGPDKYLCRLMRGYNDDYTVFCQTGPTVEPAETFTCEFDDLTYPIFNYVPGVQRMANVNNITPLSVRNSAQATILCQEKAVSASGANCVTRMTSANTRAGITGRQVSLAITNANGTANGWWPVLELIQS